MLFFLIEISDTIGYIPENSYRWTTSTAIYSVEMPQTFVFRLGLVPS